METRVKSLIAKHSILVGGRKTSVSLEDAFWKALREIAVARETTLSTLVATIDAHRHAGTLSSAIRLFVLGVYVDEIAKMHGKGGIGE